MIKTKNKALWLVNARLVCNSFALVNLLVTAYVTLLLVDVTVDPDPLVRAYQSVRWKLLTCWFNVVSIIYLLLCIYCDWREKQRCELPHLAVPRHARDVLMTAILLPTTAYCDFLFWLLFTTYPEVIAPVRVFDYLPSWSQHSLHTVSMVIVILDLILTPREKPKTMKYRLAMLYAFASAYCITLYVCFLNGEMVYTFLEHANSAVFIVVSIILFYVLLTIFFYMQWPLIEFVWGKRPIENKNKIK